MIDSWIYATGAVVVGLLSGVVGAALVRRIVLDGRRDRPEAQDAARAAGIFLFLFFAGVGVVVAIGFTKSETLEPVPAELLRASPRVLAAGLILIAGRAIAFAVGGVTSALLVGSGGGLRSRLASMARGVVSAVAVVLALSQLGVETTILSVVAGCLLAGVTLAFALLVGLGGRELGTEIAAGRSVSRLVKVGDEVMVDGVSGRVAALHPASIELVEQDGTVVHLANTRCTRGELRVRQSPTNPGGGPSR